MSAITTGLVNPTTSQFAVVSGTPGVNDILTTNDLVATRVTANIVNATTIGATTITSPVTPKAFGQFTGATGVMNNSFNASVSRTNTGIYAVTFTTPLANANYVVLVNQTGTGDGNTISIQSTGLLSTGFGIVAEDSTNKNNLDPVAVSFIVFKA